MTRFEKITKDIDLFIEWITINCCPCDFCDKIDTECKYTCVENVKKYLEQEVE